MAMSIEDELCDVRSKYSSCEGVDLVSCVPMMVRFHLARSKTKKMDLCLQFPADYPNSLILLEAKSKTLPDKFLSSINHVLEKNKQKYIGRPQVLDVLRFGIEHLEANPLCVCVEEISAFKKLLDLNGERDFCKIKQKQSSVYMRAEKAKYFCEVKFLIPDDYPHERVQFEIVASNIPNIFQTFIEAQASEIARKCVEPPLLRGKKGQRKAPKPVVFEIKPSLEPVARFMIENVKYYPTQSCGLCNKPCFPADPSLVVEDLNSTEHIERVYCNHIFHNGCMDKYMKTPPFAGGKKCPKCESVIYHGKWKASEQIREERWAHEQAKQRELEEVEDFLK